jgi:hypothetical protein
MDELMLFILPLLFHICNLLLNRGSEGNILESLRFCTALSLRFSKLESCSKETLLLGEITPSYILHTRAFGTYLLGGLFTLQKRL